MPETIRNERRILGGAVRCIRDLKQIKQAELATTAGAFLESGKLHFAYLSNIENGKKQPSAEVIAALANALKVDIDAISYMAVVYTVGEAAA